LSLAGTTNGCGRNRHRLALPLDGCWRQPGSGSATDRREAEPRETIVRYEMMLPYQIRRAIGENWPVVLPLGVLEYHGEHMAVGMDTIAVIEALNDLERETDIVILPPFYYGAASYAVEPPEGNGSLQVNADRLFPMAQDMFKGLLRIGFRNIHFLIHHQSENFAAGMPTDLAFKFAARQAIFEFLEHERGEGWWGKAGASNYYAQHEKGDDPFNWISGHPLMTPEITAQYPFDHAGVGETSLMLAMRPEAVDMSRLDPTKWYAESAGMATAELGTKGRRLILDHLRQVLGVGR
jgi:creatinine amidohydrolase/Fe(II)-dependent formamide hydrolase-like protein